MALRQATPNDIKILATVFEEQSEANGGGYALGEIQEFQDGIVCPYLAWKGCCVGGGTVGWEFLFVPISPLPPRPITLEEVEEKRREYENILAEYKKQQENKNE